MSAIRTRNDVWTRERRKMKTPFIVSAVVLCVFVSTRVTAVPDDALVSDSADDFLEDAKIRAPRSAAAFDEALPERELYDPDEFVRNRRGSWFHKAGKLITAPFRKVYRFIKPKKYEKYKQFYKYNKYKHLRKYGKYNKYKNFYKYNKYA